MATCVSAIPLTWLSMFRSADLASSRAVRFTTSWESAAERLNDPRSLQHMFAAYGDVSQHTSMLVDTIADHVSASTSARGSRRVSLDVSEIVGEHPDPLAWARTLGEALDVLDSPSPVPAPFAPLETADAKMTEIDKIRRLRRAGDLGIGEARSRLRDHEGDLSAALESIEAGKSHGERARDRVGAFVAGLVNPVPLERPAWQVLMEASALEHGIAFPPADLLLQPSPASDSDLRTHARLLGEAVVAGTVSWEPGFLLGS